MADLTRVDVSFNEDAIERLLTSPAMVSELQQRADRIAAAANNASSWGGYHASASGEGRRAHAHIWNVKHGAIDDESRNNRLIRSLDAGR